VGGEWVRRAEARELRAIVCGPPSLDVDAMRAAVTYGADNAGGERFEIWAAHASSAELHAVGLFWKAVELLPQADVRRLLWWWTGSDAPPLGGFGAMEHHWSDFWNIRGVQIAVKPRRHPLPDQLQAHTCFNQLEMPRFGRSTCAHLATPEAVAAYISALVRAAERTPLDFRDG
jgi:hypothetical protein